MSDPTDKHGPRDPNEQFVPDRNDDHLPRWLEQQLEGAVRLLIEREMLSAHCSRRVAAERVLKKLQIAGGR